MKKLRLLLLSLLSLVMLCASATLFASCGEEDNSEGTESTGSAGLSYILSDGGSSYTVTGIGTCEDTDIVIPSTYNKLPVTAIGESAFQNQSNLTGITISENITTIGQNAFYNCTGLTKINYNAIAANDVLSGAFADAGKAEAGIEVYIGACVTKIPGSLFCTYVYDYYPNIISVTFEEGSVCDSIRANAFWFENDCLESIKIPDSVTSIGASAFRDCNALEDIEIGNAVMSIGEYAFNNTKYYNDSNNWRNGVLYLEATDGRTKYLLTTDYSISGTYELEEGTRVIADYANLGGMTEILMGEDLITIGAYALYGCSTLTEVVIPDSVTSIGDGAFSFCDGLKSITIGKNTIKIGKGVFSSCTNLTSIIFKDSDNWYGTIDSSYTSGRQFDVSDSSTAASYFLEYYQYYWYKE